MPHTARRLNDLVNPIHMVAYRADEPTDAFLARGLRNYWDGYFAGRAAPLGRVPAEVVDAAFYNFAPGEVARHVPRVWETVTPEEALVVRQAGCVAALHRILGAGADSPAVTRAAELAATAATSAPTEGRVLYAALRALPLPEEPLALLWHASTLLREYRGDVHIAALVTEGVGRLECHALHALYDGMPAERFGRIHHLPSAMLAQVADGMRSRGLIDSDGWLTAHGRATKERVEAVTDDLAWTPYSALSTTEIDRLSVDLEPIAELVEVDATH